jgi:hypothetical protein
MSNDNVCARIVALLKIREMTTEELRQELAVARSTVDNMVKYLRQEKRVCVVRYAYTGVKPVRYLGLGAVDVPKPPPLSSAESSQRKREARKRREEANKAQPSFTPRRDIAASWI